MSKLIYDSINIGGRFVHPDSTDILVLVSPVTEEEAAEALAAVEEEARYR